MTRSAAPALRLSLDERLLLVRQLHVLQKAGVPLLSSLRALESQVSPGTLKAVLGRLVQELLNGATLSQAFARHPRAFDALFVGFIRVGEAGGLLEEALRQLAGLCEWELDLRARLRQALQYPAIVLATLSGAVGIMVAFVLPRFAQFFSSLNIQLPLQTRLVLGISRLLSRQGWLVALLLAAAVGGWLRFTHTSKGRLAWHRRLLRLPAIGSLALEMAMARFAHVLAALSASGVPMLETLALARESMNNTYIQQRIEAARERVKAGESLAAALKATDVVPPVVLQMVSTGQESGHLEELLRSVADYYDQQAAYRLKRLILYIEPALLLLVGGGVLLMAMAVLVPMWDLVKVLKQGG